jgi:hypothetical protein
LHLGTASMEDIYKFSGVKNEAKVKRVGWIKRTVGRGVSTTVSMRRWEYIAYKIYDAAIYALELMFRAARERIKVWIYRASRNPLLRVEWRIEDGKVVRRRWSGPYGSFKFIGGRVVKVSDRPDVEGTDADFVIAEASEHAMNRADERKKKRVRDAELFALSSKASRSVARTSEEIEWGAKNT